MKTAFLLGVFAAILIAGCAPVRHENSFEALDTNNDGSVSRQEAQARSDVVVNWRRIDQNDDGQLDVVEFSAFERARGVAPPGGTYQGYKW